MKLQELKEKLDMAVNSLNDKKAENIDIINITHLSILADYFVICSGTSSRHIKTLADHLQERMKERGFDPLHLEGYNSGGWILIDYGDIVVHIFQERERSFYNIERLWSDGILTNFKDVSR